MATKLEAVGVGGTDKAASSGEAFGKYPSGAAAGDVFGKRVGDSVGEAVGKLVREAMSAHAVIETVGAAVRKSKCRRSSWKISGWSLESLQWLTRTLLENHSLIYNLNVNGRHKLIFGFHSEALNDSVIVLI